MTGPSLRDSSAHSSIHYAVKSEIEKAINKLEREREQGHTIKAKEVELLIGIWEGKVLAHAHEEENGLYAEILRTSPVLNEKLVRLSRDHELMRILTEKIKSLSVSMENEKKILEISRALLLILEVHTKEEEEILAKAF